MCNNTNKNRKYLRNGVKINKYWKRRLQRNLDVKYVHDFSLSTKCKEYYNISK